jgi:D-alanyl-D-alanine carboxypeptidase
MAFQRLFKQVLSLGTLLVLTTISVGSATLAKPVSKPELPFAKELQDELDNGIKKIKGKGISVAIIVPEYKTWIGVSGVSHSNIPIKPETLFNAGSITKNFVAALILKLAEEGRLALDDPLHKWLPDYQHIDNTITIRQLLNHTSGIPAIQGRSFVRPILKNPKKYWTPKEVIKAFVHKSQFPKGNGWHYSNAGYILLGMIIEKATGSKLSIEFRNRFWNPLGLNSIYLAGEEELPGNIAHGWIDLDGDKIPDDFSVYPKTAYYSSMKGADGGVSTSEDLAKWTHALFYEGRVVSKESLDQMLSFHSPIPIPIVDGYGLGVETFTPRIFYDLELWGHGGNALGYTCFIWYLPEYGVSIGFMSNREQYNELYLWLIKDFWKVIKNNLEKTL